MRARRQKLLEDRVYDYIRGQNLVTPGDRIVAAVSGGPDSVALLHLLYNLRNVLKITIVVAHLDHNLRGEESAGDALYVAGLAQSLGLPFSIGGRDVERYRTRHKLTLEEAAREVRYQYLADVVTESGASMVATGHNRNDNVETILMHLIRGTGTLGLKGLAPITKRKVNGRGLKIIRPLLEVTRDEIEEFCKNRGLTPRTDGTNLIPSAFRNRIRLELLPILKEYNPGIDKALLRLANIAGDELCYLAKETDKAWREIAGRCGDAVVFSREGFDALHPAIQRSLLRRAAGEIYGTLKDVEALHIEDILGHLDRGAGKQIEMKGGVVFTIEHGRYLLAKKGETLCPFPPVEEEVELAVPGVTAAGDWRFITRVVDGAVVGHDAAPFTCYLDFGKTGSSLLARRRKDGDRFVPLGRTSEKKIKDYLIDARVPRSWRDSIPVLVSPERVIWLAGYRIDDTVKVTDATQKTLRIEVTYTASECPAAEDEII